MDVRLTDEQQMLQAMVGEVAARLGALRASAPGADARLAADPDAWQTLAGLGLVGLHMPGGAGGGTVENALIAERLAEALVPVPFIGAAAWVPALLAEAGAAEAIQAVACGQLRLAPVLRPDLSGLAAPGEDGIAFDAQAAAAGILVGGEGSLHAVSLGEEARGADLTRTLRRVPAGAPPAGLPVTLGAAMAPDGRRRAEAAALAVLGADLVGVAEGALDEAVAHVTQREQFGVPVGSFQAVQHLAAHAKVLTEGARSSMWHAAWAADELEPGPALLAARQAKAFCSSAAREVGEISIQLLGGIGFTWEHLAHVRLRRILLSRQVLGDEAAQHAAIARTRLGSGCAAALRR
jgi:alkylation response protein AidB-like acyl-CoA dehydrogenase